MTPGRAPVRDATARRRPLEGVHRRRRASSGRTGKARLGLVDAGLLRARRDLRAVARAVRCRTKRLRPPPPAAARTGSARRPPARTSSASSSRRSRLAWSSASSPGLLATIVAVLIGLSWGYVRAARRRGDELHRQPVPGVPGLPLMIVIAAYLHERRPVSHHHRRRHHRVGVGCARAAQPDRQSLRSRDFVTAAPVQRRRPCRIVFREILPNMTSLIVGELLRRGDRRDPGRGRPGVPRARRPEHVSWGTMLFWAQNSNALLTGQWLHARSRPASASPCSRMSLTSASTSAWTR